MQSNNDAKPLFLPPYVSKRNSYIRRVAAGWHSRKEILEPGHHFGSDRARSDMI
jgi:hypothetical protein